ncbi:ubiquitin carboxyl-terminal hydrolase calypso isoform X2 [Centruroides vittatus]|uniref:ubiquitin carboxyl-terminal hydrolase calypso isoform X2 n=1 Tax=Centruroides vittatus TaxID=120091 RepID=UPI00350FC295
MPIDLNKLTEGWLELESDPGVFTLLLEDFGVRGVQVEEIYDLQKPIEGPVYGFIFLFKWIEERRCRRKVVVEESFVEDEEIVNSIFFAQQMVPNSCATHALLSVLLNCSKIHLGQTLTRLKNHTTNMSPENKGYAIGNTPELARAHNSHAKPEPRHLHEKSHGVSTGRTMEAFHFVSYVPINGRLFELDGLKPYPIDHGPWAEGEDWTEKFGRVITERLGIATGGGESFHDVRFNLMAVVPDRRIAYEQKLRILKTNRQIVLEALQQLVKLTHPELTSDDHAVYMAAVKKSKGKTNSDQQNTQSNQLLSGTSQKSVTSSHSTSIANASFPKLPPALDSHNYAKSPLMEGVDPTGVQPRYEDYSGSDYSDEDRNSPGHRRNKQKSTGNGSVLSSTEETPEQKTSESQQNQSENSNSQSSKEECEIEQTTMEPLTINTSTDFMKPLTIQTKFQPSPTPSASSTDTSSEAGSAFNSPVRSVQYNFTQGSPNSAGKNVKALENTLLEDVRDIKKFVVIRVTSSNGVSTTEEAKISKSTNSEVKISESKPESQPSDANKTIALDNEIPPKKPCLEESNVTNQEKDSSIKDSACNADHSSNDSYEEKANNTDNIYTSLSSDESKNSHKIGISKHPHLVEPHKFAPKDLLALLKTVESEISVCESNLRDETEKRKKYKIDDCRRTHCYDQFICTFLSMLAEQGKLADLVEQQLLVRRRQGVHVGRLHKTKKPDRRRKSRTKKRK